ncbi:hypothetical protein HYS85_00235, partial [Candidatus Saccharibacteria bacterium]|nr:hypothetical protein [Candidatus Saccharibacteria bacterium]
MANITLSAIATRVANLLGSDAQLSTAEIQSIAIARYEHLHDANPWSKRRKPFTINLVGLSGNSGAGAVAVTRNSAFVSSNGTPFASTDDGRWIRLGEEEQYFALSFNTTSTIILTDGKGQSANWPAATSSNVGYTVFQTLYDLPGDCDVVLTLAANYPLEEMDGGREFMDRLDPNRISSSSDPTHWVYSGATSQNIRQIEVWPVPSDARTLRGMYLTEAPVVSSTTVITIHPAVFTYAVASDCYNMLFSKTGDQSYQHLALFYEKKYAETKNDIMPWEVAKNSP